MKCSYCGQFGKIKQLNGNLLCKYCTDDFYYETNISSLFNTQPFCCSEAMFLSDKNLDEKWGYWRCYNCNNRKITEW